MPISGNASTVENSIATGNSTSSNLLAAATFTGSWQECIKFANISIMVNASHASATDGLKLEFSSDGTNIDSSDVYTVPASTGKIYSLGVVGRYFRIRYVNGSTNTTHLRIQTIFHSIAPKPSSHRISDAIVSDDDAELMKAVLTGLNPDGDFQNVGVTERGALKNALFDPETGVPAVVCNTGALRIMQTKYLCGGNFFTTTLLPNIWAETIANDGTIVSGAGVVTIRTNTTANGSAKLTTVKKGRFLSGQNNEFFSGVRLGDTGVTNNVRRWGVYNDDNGYFFQLSGTTFSAGIRKAGVDTIINSTSFNGNTPIVIDTNYHLYQIVYRFGGAHFYQDRNLVHTLTFNTEGTLVGDANLPIRHESTNSGGATTDCVLQCRGTSINRYGDAEPSPRYSNITTATTTTLRNNCGTLHRIAINKKGTAAATMTIYDSATASGTIIATIDLTDILGFIDYVLDFDNGLTLVTTGTNIDCTVLYS